MKRVLLEGHDEAVAQFVADFSPIERPVFAPGYRAFGVLRSDGQLVAGVVLSDWRPQFRTIELSAAAVSSFAFGPQIVAAVSAYVFEKLEVHRVWAKTALKNERAKRMLRGLGFIQEAVISHHYGPRSHACQWRVLKPEWENRSRTTEVAQKAA